MNYDVKQEVLGGNKFINKGDDFYDIFGRIFGIATFSAAGQLYAKYETIPSLLLVFTKVSIT